MIYPDVTVEEWLRRYPVFREDIPSECICGREINSFKPIIFKDRVGIVSGLCACGVDGGVSVTIARTGGGMVKDRDLFSMFGL